MPSRNRHVRLASVAVVLALHAAPSCKATTDQTKTGESSDFALSLGGGTLAMAVGESVTLHASPVGANGQPFAGLYTLMWASSDAAVAAVAADGTVTARARGAATVTATATRIDTGAVANATVPVTVDGGSSPPPEPPPPPASGETLRPDVSGLCLAAAGAIANGTHILQASCGASALRFLESMNAAGTELRVGGTSFCVDLPHGSVADGDLLQIFSCDGSDDQRFVPVPYGNGRRGFKAAISGKCFDIQGATSQSGALVQQWGCGDVAEQRFSTDSSSGGGDAGGGTDAGGGADAGGGSPGPVPPAGATVIASSDWAKEAAAIDARTAGSGPGVQDDWDGVGTHIWLTRSEEEGTAVVTRNGVHYLETTIADGRNWQGDGYDRSEYSIDYNFRDGQKYVLEWRGMIPSAWPSAGIVTVMFQVHMDNGTVPSFAFNTNDDRLLFYDCMSPEVTDVATCAHGKTYDIAAHADFVGRPLTIRLTLVSSLANGYVKLEIDGRQIFERSGRTTLVAGGDWLKDGTLYDWGTDWVSPSQASRGRAYSLLTEYSRIWMVP